MRLYLIIITFLFVGFNFIYSQNGLLDTTFNSHDFGYGMGDGTSGVVLISEVQNDDKIIIGGTFLKYNWKEKNSLVRINYDGSIDTTYDVGTGIYGSISSSALQSDGKLIIAGLIYDYNDYPVNHLARINTDGSLDISFNTGIGFDGQTYDVAIQSDGKLVVSGYFNTYNGVYLNGFCRLHSNGSLDTTFSQVYLNNHIHSMAIQADGKIIIAGNFTSYNFVTMNRIARINIDNSLDTTFDIGSGADSYIDHISIQSNGQLLMDFLLIRLQG